MTARPSQTARPQGEELGLTLQGEQGRRAPSGAAPALIRMACTHPGVAGEARHRGAAAPRSVYRSARVLRGFTGLPIAAVLSACASITPGPDLDTARHLVPALAAAFSACELDKIASLYAPTAEFLAPDTSRPVIGRAAITRHLAGACTASYKPVMTVLEQRAYPLGRHGAVVSGTYTFGRTDRPNDAPWAAAFVITLVGADGRWLIQSQASFAAPR